MDFGELYSKSFFSHICNNPTYYILTQNLIRDSDINLVLISGGRGTKLNPSKNSMKDTNYTQM